MIEAPKDDCLHFQGDKPCRFKRLCSGCPHFEPLGERTKILIIKCRAQGDVLRTTALLPGLGRKYPRRHVTWVVDPESVDLLASNPFLDKVVPFEPESLMPLTVRPFDVVISLDKEPGPAALATAVRAAEKFGFGLNAHGNLSVFNEGSTYAFRLGIDDELKYRRNLKTYQEIAAEAAGIDYRRDEYVFDAGPDFQRKAIEYVKLHAIDLARPSVGLNTGAGSKFETKQWPREHYLEVIQELTSSFQANVFLLGGQREREFNTALEKRTTRRVFNTGGDHSLPEFAGFLSLMNAVVTSDTLGMHLAIALKKNVIALFGPTCPQEIDLYGRGVKLYKSVPCSPCYKQTCPEPRCMKEIAPGRVLEEIRKVLR